MKSPCYKCPHRHIGCHAICDKYKEFEASREEIRKARWNGSKFVEYTCAHYDRMWHNKHIRNRGR